MKRFSFNSGLFIAGLLFICSCADDSISEKLRATSDYMSLELNVNTINIKGDASTQTVYVWASSSVSWVIEDIPSWITVSPRNGTGDAVVTMSFGANTQSKRSATLSVRCTDTDWPARVNLTVSQDKQVVSTTHEYVDLGLSVKWATCNVGASKPEEYGDYFAWGEIETKSTYRWYAYKYYLSGSTEEDIKLSKYVNNSNWGTVDSKMILDINDDVAHVKWGGNWRIPTYSEAWELHDNCTWTWTTVNGVYGYKITSNKTGFTSRSIFLPASGIKFESTVYYRGTVGYYWANSIAEKSYYGEGIFFNSDGHNGLNAFRYEGLPVRAVCP